MRIRREENAMYYKDDNCEENYGPEEELLINKLCKFSVRTDRVKKRHFPNINQNKPKEELLSPTEQGRYNMLLAVVPILMELRKRLGPLCGEFKKEKKLTELERMESVLNEINMESLDISYLFNGIPMEHFLLNDNMLFILQTKLIRLEDLDFNIEESDAIYEISPIAIEEKIAWMTISIYSMATEKSFIEFN
jgi:hypothetical protein